MDPRQQSQHQAQPLAYSGSAASPYHASPFQAPSESTSFPPSVSHPPPASSQPAYNTDHQRRPSDSALPPHSSYYSPRPGTGPVPPAAHAPHPQKHQHHQRHQSSSSLSSVPSINRGAMPPSGSPPQQAPQHSQQQQPPPPQPQIQPSQQQPQQHPLPHRYGLPTPRAPTMSVGPQSSFSSNVRELPALGSVPRAPSMGSSMSIASMLGTSRNQAPQTSPQYATPSTTAPISGPTQPSPVHTSPRPPPSNSEYAARFRPHTPDISRPFDNRDRRDTRGSNAASPQQALHTPPEVPRYGTPHTSSYGRGLPLGPPDQYRDQRIAPANLPPRPSSTQPQKSFHNMPRQVVEMGHGPSEQCIRLREDAQIKYHPERPMEAYDQRLMLEKERQEKEVEMLERERRQRTLFQSDGAARQLPLEYRHPYALRNPDTRDLRDNREPRDIRDLKTIREFRDTMDAKDLRDPRDVRDPREVRKYRDIRDSRDVRNLRDVQDLHDVRDRGDIRDSRGVGDVQEVRDFRDSRELRDLRDIGGVVMRESLEMRDVRDARPTREMRDPRELSRDPRELRDPRDSGDLVNARGQVPWKQQHDRRAPHDPAGPPHLRTSDYPSGSGPPYGQHPAFSHPPERLPPPSHTAEPTTPGQVLPSPAQPYESPERQRLSLHPSHQAPPIHQPPQPSVRPVIQEPAPPPPQGPHGPETGYDRPREEFHVPPAHQRHHLLVNEINRKGRLSPLPQAVQGAQPQAHGPSGESVIKNEFGRIFPGLGAAVSGAITSPAGLAFPSHSTRHDEDMHHETKTAIGRGKRRKAANDDDNRGDDESAGRETPMNHRVKRPKAHQHHQYLLDSPSRAAKSLTKLSHHHHNVDQAPSPFMKGDKGNTSVPSTLVAKEFSTSNQHYFPSSKAPASPLQLPKVRRKIDSQEVLDSVANRPRYHLGDWVYEMKLKTAKHHDPDSPGPSRFGFASTPMPLPMDKIKGKENCTLTVKIPRAHLSGIPLEEITFRRAVWGTDVYTDDSDVIAACIHGGWVRGAWSEEVDLDMIDVPPGPDHTPEAMTAPPREGPVQVPANMDMHVTVVILPCLRKYAATTRFGMTSREWGGRYNRFQSAHDGLSFMILSVRFATSAEPASRLRGRGRRERMRKAMEQIARSRLYDISATPPNSKGSARRNGSEEGKENRANGDGSLDKTINGTRVVQNGSGHEDTEA